MDKKQKVAQAALSEIHPSLVIGMGTGSTVECLIDLLPTIDHPTVMVSSSVRTTKRLQALGIEVQSLNDVGQLDLYIDGADQVLASRVSIKGKGGAHTLEKVLATAANKFVGMISDDKMVPLLTEAIPVEVLEPARSAVSRHIVLLGGTPVYRQGVTDSGNSIIDVYGLDLTDPEQLEQQLKMIVGVVEVGVFALRRFDKVYIAGEEVKIIENTQ